MYWSIKNKNLISLTALLLCGAVSVLISCKDIGQKPDNSLNKTYFDVPVYFKNQIDSLQKVNPKVFKSVFTNNDTEKKELHINNWSAELAAFLTVDLNKPAYKEYIKKDSTNNVVTYTITKDDLDLNTVQITYNENGPFKIEIDKETKNFLYHTDEKLTYIKDSLYSTEKAQKVILMNPNDYKIIGKIK